MATTSHKLDEMTFDTRRLEALTDGVFAIAMTLLVLDLNVKAIGAAAGSGQLWTGLDHLSNQIISFVVSFLMLGSMWAVHTRQFEFIKRTDRRLITINTLRLLAVVFLPLTTSVAGAYSGIILGNILLPINFLVLSCLSYWQWHYAVTSRNRLYNAELTAAGKRYYELRNQIVILMAAAVVVLAIWFGEWAFCLFLLTPWIGRVVSRAPKA